MSSASDQEKLRPPPPHVLIFPMPVQGHLNPMLKLAHLLCLAEFHVTFIISDFNQRRLLQHTAAFSRCPGFQFRTFPDGLPDDHPRSGHRAMEFVSSVANVTVPLFKKMMIQENFLASAAHRPVTCFVADGLLSFAPDFCEENGIPFIFFVTATTSYLWALFRFPQLLEAQEIPLGGQLY
ncbi:7-deoxyloganetic acid glucosyltransferase [Salvia divinorum]|uniref:7-deoxyloganetic acid glucosyltransferase n=1 Tax=Salvia divinorum TaxID=28513 RepID=A0ABD1GGE9_SALDI